MNMSGSYAWRTRYIRHYPADRALKVYGRISLDSVGFRPAIVIAMRAKKYFREEWTLAGEERFVSRQHHTSLRRGITAETPQEVFQ